MCTLYCDVELHQMVSNDSNQNRDSSLSFGLEILYGKLVKMSL